MRKFVRDGVHWFVREIDAGRIPGAQRATCLIFECDGIVRRVWDYDPMWRDRTDEALWALLRVPADLLTPAAAAVIDAARVVSDRARSLLARLSLARETNQARRVEQPELLDQCNMLRTEMHQAVTHYTEELRASGVEPERAIVMLKSALKDGLGTCEDPGDATAEQLLHDGVGWAIEAYYAA